MVTIIDRTGEKQEFKHDQQIYKFGKKEQLVLPDEVATWMFTNADHRFRVHTLDGQFLRRYAVVDAPEGWVDGIGVDVLEMSALQRDPSRLEQWDAEEADPMRHKATVLDLSRTTHRERPGDYAHLGGDTPRVRS